MAVRRCGFCGYQIRYHGEPEGDIPVERIFCKLSDWRELEKENLTADYLESEHEEKFFYAWRCSRCGSFTGFAGYVGFSAAYTPKDEFSSAPMTEPLEFGPFWDDITWFDVTEMSTPTAEVLKKYPQTRYFAKNDNELRIYSDEARTNCVAQYQRLEPVYPVTVETMSLKSFKKILATWDDVEFFYHDVYYNFIRDADGSINIWRGHGQRDSRYCATRTDVDAIINAKFLDDGKSIAEVQDKIEL